MDRDEEDWFMPQLLSTTYRCQTREYLTEIEPVLGTEKAAG